MKALKLAKDGTLALLESSVEETIVDFLTAEGWLTFSTKAEARMPSGAPSFRRGTLDILAVRIRDYRAQIMFCEFKRRHARTGKAHLAEQRAMVEWLRERNFMVFMNSECGEDPIQEFRTFYRECF